MALLAACRFAHFIAALLAFGSGAYLRFCAPADLRKALSPGIRGIAVATSLVALATAIVWLALEAASFDDDWNAATDPGAIASILTDTAFGRAWIVHLVIAAAFAGAALFAPRDAWTSLTILSGLLLANLALVGHAAMQTGPEGLAHRANDAAHLLTTGAWIGGLVPFVLCLDRYGRNELRREAVAAMMRFSLQGHFVVAAIVATGTVNIALTSGRLPYPPTTPYRALLEVKIGLVAIMILLATVNRYVLAPRLRTSLDAAAAMRALTLMNVALGGIVVALVSVFALFDPK